MNCIKNVLIFLVSAPRITVKPSDVSYGEGETARMQCQTVGFPRPSIVWYKNDVLVPRADPRLTLDPGSGALVLSDLKNSDRGVYRCVATNVAGTTMAVARMEVHRKCARCICIYCSLR